MRKLLAGCLALCIPALLTAQTPADSISRTEAIDSVVVTARRPLMVYKQTGNIAVDIEQLKYAPLFAGEKDIFKFLQLLPGVSAGKDGMSGLLVRGGSNDQTLILYDDVPIYNQAHAYGILSIFSGETVQSAEVSKGYISPAYGSRLSALTQIRTRDGDRQDHRQSLTVGTLSLAGTVDGPIVRNKGSYLVSARYFFPEAVLALVGNAVRFGFYDLTGKLSYDIHPGEYLLLPPTVHQHGSKKGSCSFYWLHFIPGIPSAPIVAPSDPTAGSVLDEFHAAPPSSYRLEDLAPAQLPSNYPETLCIPLQRTLSSPNRVIILMKQLQDTSLRFHNTFLNNSLTAAVLGEINCQSPFYRTYTSETQRTQILQDIISYIQYHSSESLKVTELARYFGYNDKYLSSLFHEGTGMTLKQFILKSKMDSAMAELTDTNHTVSQIAYNVGFQDAHNFSTAFRKLTGMTPGQYRKSYGNRKLSFE